MSRRSSTTSHVPALLADSAPVARNERRESIIVGRQELDNAALDAAHFSGAPHQDQDIWVVTFVERSATGIEMLMSSRER